MSLRPVRYYNNIVIAIIFRKNCDTIVFACYRDNCHRNNNVLKVKAQAQNTSPRGAI